MKKTIIIIMGVILLTGCASATTPPDPFDSVHVTVSECELGSRNFDLIKTVSYNGDVPLIVISNDGGFDPDKVGNYDVTYTVTDLDEKTQDKTFTYVVKDTTPPKVTINKNEVFMKKGDAFNIKDYASASDKSGKAEIKYEGELNPDKEGKYTIKVYAEDTSGNKSDLRDMTITVDDRENCVVRNAKFGDDIETVKAWEDAELFEDSTASVPAMLIYKTQLDNIDVAVFYIFDKDNKLAKVAYDNVSEHINNQSYVEDYNKLEESLEKKYGQPDEIKNAENSLAKYAPDEGTAISMGNAIKYVQWNKDGYIIVHSVESNDSYGIYHSIVYESEGFVGTSVDDGDI